MHLRAAEGQADNGGKAGRGDRVRPSLGIRTTTDALGARIQHCLEGGAAMAAGLSAGDVIVAFDGLRVTHANLEKALAGYQPGDNIRVHAFRRDELRECTAVVRGAPKDTCWLTFGDGADSAARSAWPGLPGGS